MTLGKSDQVDAEHLGRLVALRPELSSLVPSAEPGAPLPDPSPAGRRALLDALTDWRNARDRLGPADVEDAHTFRLDQRVLSASLELLRFSEQEVGLHRKDPDVLCDVLRLLLDGRGTPGASRDERLQAIAHRLAALPGYLVAARANVKEPHPWLSQHARKTVEDARSLLASFAHEAQRASSEGTLSASVYEDLERSLRTAEEGIAAHEAWLSSLTPGEATPLLGPERFEQLLHLRALDITAAEMAEIARSMIEEMRIEQSRLLRRFFRKQSRQEALARARGQVALSVEELLAWTAELVEQARSFVLESELFPIAADEHVVVESLPSGFAFPAHGALLFPPAPREGVDISRLLLPCDDGALLAAFSVADLENLVAFFGYPGVHLLRVWTQRTTSLARAGVPMGFVGGLASTWGLETVLGWGQHMEELMRELQFRDSPAARLVAVRNALYRAVLAYLDVALGTGAVFPKMAVEVLVEEGGVFRPRAEADVRACLRRPSEGLSPLLGKMRLAQLRREAKALWRGGYTEKRFHEIVLFGGTMPLTYHFELLDAPSPFASNEGTAEYAIGEAPDDIRRAHDVHAPIDDHGERVLADEEPTDPTNGA